MKTYNAEDYLTIGKKYLDRQKSWSNRESRKKNKKACHDPEARSHISYITPNTKAHFLQHQSSGAETKQRLLHALEDRPALVHWEVTRFNASLRQSNTRQNHSNDVSSSLPYPNEIPH